MSGVFGILPGAPPPDPGLELASDHKQRAIGVLLAEFKSMARFTTLIDILTRPFQEIENVLWDLYTKRRIDSALGVQLDVIGRILVEPRSGLGDEDYRAILRIKARVIFASGTGPSMIQICQLFLLTNNFVYDELFPLAMQITVYEDITDSRLRLLGRFLRRARPAGVRLDTIDARGGLATRFHYGAEGTGVGYGVGKYGGLV